MNDTVVGVNRNAMSNYCLNVESRVSLCNFEAHIQLEITTQYIRSVAS